MFFEVITIGFEKYIGNFLAGEILSEITNKILKRDHIKSAVSETIDELIEENPDDFFVLEEIERNRKDIFNHIEIADKKNFKKILIDNGVESETAIKLIRKFTEKFNENIKEAAMKNPDVFYPYAILEFENININNKEKIKILMDFAQTLKTDLGKIIEHFKELEKKENEIIHLSRIEYELEKGVELKGKFFRKEGPLWIDFEDDYVVERKEVKEIIKTFEKGCTSVLLEGNAASGKSVIARNVGYKLANKKDVYYMSSEEFEIHTVDAIFNDIRKLEDSVIIIEDAHLYPKYCDGLLDDILKNKVGIKILITTRYTPIYKYIRLKQLNKCGEKDEKKENKCKKITLKAFEYLFCWDNIPGDDNERLIEFLNRHYIIDLVKTAEIKKIDGGRAIKVYNGKKFVSLSLNDEKTKVYLEIDYDRTYELIAKTENSKLNIYSFDYAKYIIKNYMEKKGLPEPSVEEIEGLLSQSKKSLWLLAYFLMAWKPRNPNDIQQIYNNVLHDLKGLRYTYRINDPYPEHVIFTIALFYQFEIKVQITFLTFQLKLNEITIEKLSDVGEIRKSKSYLSLHHSAIAEIYKDASENASENDSDFIDWLSDKLRQFDEKFEKENYIAFLFRLYLRYKPKNYDEVIYQLRFKEEILNFILIDENTYNAIHDLLDKESNIRKIADVASIIITINRKVGLNLFESLIIGNFKIKIEQELSFETIRNIIRDISNPNRDVAKMIVEHLNFNILKSKIENEETLEKKIIALNVICYVHRRIGEELIESLGLKSIMEKEKEPLEKNWWNISLSDYVH